MYIKLSKNIQLLIVISGQTTKPKSYSFCITLQPYTNMVTPIPNGVCIIILAKINSVHNVHLLQHVAEKKANSWPAAVFTFDFLPKYVWANQSESIAFRLAIIWPWKTHTHTHKKRYIQRVYIDTRLKTHLFLLISQRARYEVDQSILLLHWCPWITQATIGLRQTQKLRDCSWIV